MRTMMSITLCILSSTFVLADVSSPAFRNIDPIMSFAGVEEHPDHVFLIHVQDGQSVTLQERIIPIPGPEPFIPGFRRRIKKVTILAVPKAEYEQQSKDAALPFSPESPGVTACDIPSPSTTVRRDSHDPDVLRYGVVMHDGILRVSPVPAKSRDSTLVAPSPGRAAWWGIALAASIAWLGLMIGRRLLRGS